MTSLRFGGDPENVQEAGKKLCPAGEAAEGSTRASRDREAGPLPSFLFFSPEMDPQSDRAGHATWRGKCYPREGRRWTRAGVLVCGHREGDPSKEWGDSVGRTGNLKRRTPIPDRTLEAHIQKGSE